jgi:Ankyrin repeats (3 copies)
METHFRYSMPQEAQPPETCGRKRKLTSNDGSSARQLKVQVPKSSHTLCERCPAAYALRLFQENGLDVLVDPSIVSVPFVQPTEEHIAAYLTDTVRAVQAGNVQELRKLQKSGVSLDCCNRFGESVISAACRRGNSDVVRFLVLEAKVSLLLRDDFGRTVLHDAFWTPEPNVELVEFLLRIVPDLLCVKDQRGHAPLDYVRSEHWERWIEFMEERRGLFLLKFSGQVKGEAFGTSSNANGKQSI